MNFPQSDWGKSVTRTPRTKTTDNITGRESWADGTPATITAVVVRSTKAWMFDKEGQIEGGDAYLMGAYNLTINEGDLITDDSIKYYVKNLLTLPDTTNPLVKYANLFIWSD